MWILHTIQYQQERRFLKAIQQGDEAALVPEFRALRLCHHTLVTGVLGHAVQFGARHPLHAYTGFLRQFCHPG